MGRMIVQQTGIDVALLFRGRIRRRAIDRQLELPVPVQIVYRFDHLLNDL